MRLSSRTSGARGSDVISDSRRHRRRNFENFIKPSDYLTSDKNFSNCVGCVDRVYRAGSAKMKSAFGDAAATDTVWIPDTGGFR